jgi:hypothetical protein
MSLTTATNNCSDGNAAWNKELEPVALPMECVTQGFSYATEFIQEKKETGAFGDMDFSYGVSCRRATKT